MSTTVKLLTGLSRGNLKFVAQQVVEIPDGLAARLIERKQAIATDAKPDTVEKAIKKTQAAAAKKAAKPKPAAKKDDAPGAPVPGEGEGENDTPTPGENDAPVPGENDAPADGENKE